MVFSQKRKAAVVSVKRESKVEDLNLISDFRLIFRSCGNYSDDQIRQVLRGLVNVRQMDEYLSSAPRHLLQSINAGREFNGKCVYACDVIQLREILSEQHITSQKPVVLFSPQTTKNVIDGYNCLVLLRCEAEDLDCEHLKAGGMIVCDTHSLDITGKIAGVILQKGAPYKVVQKIVSETIPECPVYGKALIPGVDQTKVASTNKKRRFQITLPALRIVEEVMASNDYEAVKKALAIRWDRHPDSRTQRKPARYSADYWLYSGFWDYIVKESSSDMNIKTAQANVPTLNLTTDEQKVFQTILAIDAEFGLGQQYRVAGGWVRDRILGTESDDIDIALDQMTGQEFRKYVEQYAARHPEAEIGKSYVVDQNPDASKHLETTAIQIGPFKIDFVNLRTEDYASDSRIPNMRPGTPEEDASRRDLTINALFYNIGTGQIEDYVGGLEDIQTLTLRTPLDSKQTFEDDPLRILRVLRFHSRYEGSQIAPETLEGMAHPDVHEAYRKKVSPERAGPEIMKLFSGATPEESLRVLYDTGMDAALLNLPDFTNLQGSDMDQRNPNHQLNWRDHTLKVVKNLNDILAQNGVDGKRRSLALMGAWFHDFGKLHPEIARPKDDNPDHMTYHGHEDVSADLSEVFLKSIGIGKDDREIVNTIVREHMTPHNYGKEWNKRQMGKFRSKTTIPGQEDDQELWKIVMWHAHADAAAKSEESQVADYPEYQERFDAMNEYMNAPPPVKPLVDGRTLMQLFPTLSPKSGFIRFIHEKLLDEQGAGNVTDMASAQSFVESLSPEVESTFGQPRTESSMSNWYRRNIKADASSGAGPEGYNAGPESDTAMDRHRDQKKMLRYEPGENSRFRTGDKVRRRQSGLAMPQIAGKVVKKQDGMLHVKWEDGKTEKFDMNDVELPLLVERV